VRFKCYIGTSPAYINKKGEIQSSLYYTTFEAEWKHSFPPPTQTDWRIRLRSAQASIGFVLWDPPADLFCHRPLGEKYLHVFGLSKDWLCFVSRASRPRVPRVSPYGTPWVLPSIGFVFSTTFSQYASRSTQYEMDWLCFFNYD
jgi:hypothetical protein